MLYEIRTVGELANESDPLVTYYPYILFPRISGSFRMLSIESDNCPLNSTKFVVCGLMKQGNF